MEMTVFITLLEIQVTVVALVDCSGFMDWLKGQIGRWLGVKGGISLKPLDCTDMIQLHAIYKRHINPGHTPNTWCGNCNMNVLRGLAVFLKKAE